MKLNFCQRLSLVDLSIVLLNLRRNAQQRNASCLHVLHLVVTTAVVVVVVMVQALLRNNRVEHQAQVSEHQHRDSDKQI